MSHWIFLRKEWTMGSKVLWEKPCTIRVVYGVTEEEFKLHQSNLSEVEDKCRKWSKKVSRGETNTATKP